MNKTAIRCSKNYTYTTVAPINVRIHLVLCGIYLGTRYALSIIQTGWIAPQTLFWLLNLVIMSLRTDILYVMTGQNLSTI